MTTVRANSGQLGGILAAALCAVAPTTPASADKASNSLRFATEQVPSSVDPYFNNLMIGAYIADNVWDSLLYRNPTNGDYEPGLATAWRWVDDRTLELELRAGVRFHNGEPFGADDVVYTLMFAANPANKLARADASLWIDHVEKVGELEVRIHTKQVYPAAISALASPMSAMHPHRYYAQVGPQGMNKRPIGTGPYRVVEHAFGKHITLERNPDYFVGSPKAKPRIDTVEIRFIPDPTTQVAEVVAGTLDLIMNVARDQAQQLRDIPRLQVVTGESAVITYIQLNTLPTTPATQLLDERVRRAIMHAIDRETMIRFLQGDGARLLHVQCHPIQFGCSDAGAPRYRYDPGESRALLAEAGYPDGFEIDLYATSRRNEAEAIANYLNAVGIRTRLRFMQTSAVIAAVRAGRTALAYFGQNVGLSADVSRSLPLEHTFLNQDLNRDPDVRDLILRGNSVLEPEQRRRAYAEALALIAERAYVLPLYAVAHQFVADKDLVFTPYPDTAPRFYEMYWR